MKILVYAHRLEVGGTQVNAIELAAALRDFHDFEVVFFAQPGPMSHLVETKGLRFLPAPDARIHPSLARMRELRTVVRRERPQLLHVWDWWQCLDAYYAVHLPMQIPMVVSDMMMALTRILPRHLPTTLGVPELVDQAKAVSRQRVDLMVPPVDISLNSPDTSRRQDIRERHHLEEKDICLVIVSRLSEWMKSASIIQTIEAVRTLGREFPLKLVIAGDGAARSKLERLAADANSELQRSAITFLGALIDPRPVYDCADIVIGMGGSALRGMAFGKPVIIVGERGFASVFSPENARDFYYRGIYGLGTGTDGTQLIEAIRQLAKDPSRRTMLGGFSRQFVVQHFSLEVVSARFAHFCRAVVAEPFSYRHAFVDGLRTAAIYLRERRFLTPSRDRTYQFSVSDR